MGKGENQMINFIIGAIVGGIVSLFCIALVTTNKNVENIESDYYMNNYFSTVHMVSTIIDKYNDGELTAENAIKEIEIGLMVQK